MAGWTLDDIAWEAIDPLRVTPDIVSLVEAASLVESNATDYRDYLCNVFADDPRVCTSVAGWAVEEERHGAALARCASLIDPKFNFDTSFQAFVNGYGIPVNATASVRGSRSGEMIARCMVETGTNSFYSALSQASNEPVLKEICRLIADDEFAHFKLFHRHMQRYLELDNLNLLDRLRIVFGRIAESEDDELAFAYYAANGASEVYERRRNAGAYERQALAYYSPLIVRRAIEVIFSTIGLGQNQILSKVVSVAAYSMILCRRQWLRYALPS